MDWRKTCLIGRSVGKTALLGLSLALLASCRLVITTDDGGQIISSSGQADCSSERCVFPVSEEVTETFTAVAANGYRFVRWEGLCVRSPVEACEVTVFPLPEEFSRFDGDIGLSAVFEPVSKLRTWYRDRDGDNYGTPNQRKTAAARPEGFVVNNSDCNDYDDSVHPFTKEREDGKDNNCNGMTDEGFVDIRFYADNDKDGFGDPNASILKRRKPGGYVLNDLDCNDSSADDYPDAPELADDRDNDCDGSVDEGGSSWFRDVDGDGFGSAADTMTGLAPLAGYVDSDTDCDDNNASIYPGAEEIFDSADNNCDGEIDEGFTQREFYRDADGDGFGDPDDTAFGLSAPEGYANVAGDNCPDTANPNQSDMDGDGIGDACDAFTDTDADGVQDSADNCPVNANPEQGDVDNDGLGDACDSQNGLDPDNDGLNTGADNCPQAYNPDQADTDNDGLGDACDHQNGLDPDNDGINNSADNCPQDYNPDQADTDNDGLGDACDSVNNGGGFTCASTQEAQAMLDAVNAFRAQTRDCGSKGTYPAVGALSWSCPLEEAALTHSMDMANNNFFSHTGSDGSSAGLRATRAGYNWWTWGENIAAGYPSVSAAMQGWIDSDGHCANMMNANFANMGSAKYSNSDSTYGIYWTQVFGAAN